MESPEILILILNMKLCGLFIKGFLTLLRMLIIKGNSVTHEWQYMTVISYDPRFGS